MATAEWNWDKPQQVAQGSEIIEKAMRKYFDDSVWRLKKSLARIRLYKRLSKGDGTFAAIYGSKQRWKGLSEEQRSTLFEVAVEREATKIFDHEIHVDVKEDGGSAQAEDTFRPGSETDVVADDPTESSPGPACSGNESVSESCVADAPDTAGDHLDSDIAAEGSGDIDSDGSGSRCAGRREETPPPGSESNPITMDDVREKLGELFGNPDNQPPMNRKERRARSKASRTIIVETPVKKPKTKRTKKVRPSTEPDEEKPDQSVSGIVGDMDLDL